MSKRIDPDDGAAYTFEQLSEYYKGKYKKKAIEAYWETCSPAKSKKGKSKETAEPKTKAKAKAKTKVKAKAKVKVLKEKGPKPVFYYYPFAGKGELSKLIAAAGGLDIEIKDMQMAEKDERAELCKACGAVGTGLPVLEHGDHKMCQSVAIQNYLASISPKFKRLPKQAAAIDMMWGSHLEDIISEVAKTGFFGMLFGGAECKKDELKASVAKWLTCLENLTPAEGFINGKKFPTAADCVPIVLFKAAAPWALVAEHAGVDPASYPKLKGVCDRAAESPGIKEYLASSASISVNPFKK